MGGYPLARLLSVWNFREDEARKGVRAAEDGLACARREAEKRQQQLDSYRTWHAAEVDRRYAVIMGQVLSLKELDAFKNGLAQLEATQLLREKALEDALAAQEVRRAVLAEARERAAAARRGTAKIKAHREIWQREDARERERLEELELEDVRPAGAAAPSGGSGRKGGKG